MYLGTSLLCLGVLLLEILATRVLGIVAGPETVYYTVAVAMLGMGAAGSLTSVVPGPKSLRNALRAAAIFSALAGLSVIVFFRLATLVKQGMNTAAEKDMSAGGFQALVRQVADSHAAAALWLGALLAVPYFFSGAALCILFRACPADRQHRLYGADLIGAAAGCGAAVVLMELTGFSPPLLAAAVLPLLASAAYLRSSQPRTAVLALIVSGLVSGALLLPDVQQGLEPRPRPSRLGRYRNPGDRMEELWHTWTSYSRVAALRLWAADTQEETTAMALGLGEGHAHVRPYRGVHAETGEPDFAAALTTAACRPDRMLVLFAGAGKDMVALDEMTGGRSRITGVEMIPQVMEWPLGQAEYRLKEFLDRPSIRFVVAEAREFLERDQNTYDAILLSWAGASLAYYTGAVGHAARFTFTLEGLEAILRRLDPQGQVTILNVNKIKVMAALRAILESQGRRDAARCMVVLAERKRPPEDLDFRVPWDENRLLFKPAGFSKTDLASIRRLASDWDLEVRFAPDRPAEPGNPYDRLLAGKDLESTLDGLGEPDRLEFRIGSDDRPFLLNHFPRRSWLSPVFWNGEYEHDKGHPAVFALRFRRNHLKTIFWFAVAGLALILAPVLLVQGRRPKVRPGLRAMLFFGCLGAGFMLIEVGFVQKLGLFLGHPGHAIAVVLAALILSSGLGSLASGRLFSSGLLTFRRVAFLSAASATGLLVLVDAQRPALLALSLAVKMAVLFGLLLPVGFCLGQLFPQALARVAPGARPWALALNAATGTLASGVAIVLAQDFGFRTVILAGVACYLIAALTPPKAAFPEQCRTDLATPPLDLPQKPHPVFSVFPRPESGGVPGNPTTP